MPSWKKVIVSGSNANLAQISASVVPTATTQNLLAIDSSTGGIMQIAQSNVDSSTTATDTFKATGQRNGDSAITGSLFMLKGNITASGNIKADGDLAIGGNIFSFNGFSFIQGLAANFTGSNVFGSGSNPSANDTAGGGTAHQFTGSVAITGSSALDIFGGGITVHNGNSTFNNHVSLGADENSRIAVNGHISTRLDCRSHITASGNISASGDIIGKAIRTDTFMGTGNDVLVLHANAGQILLRPNGATSPSGMTTIDNAGLTAANLIGTDDITAGGVISSSKVDLEYSLFAHSASLNYVNAGELALPGFSNVSASLAALTAGTVGDNLGNHTATEDLDLATFSIKGITNITASGVISSSKDALINGLTIGRGGGDNIDNTAIGNLALLSSTDSNQEGNTAVGASSMQLSPIGKLNTAVGWKALYQTRASNNTSIGQDSLYNHIFGNNNVALGLEAGKTITGGSTPLITASLSTFIGAGTKAKADDETNQIVIGYGATGEGSNSVVLGNDNITKTVLKGNITASGNYSGSATSNLIVGGTINGKMPFFTHHNGNFSPTNEFFIPVNNLSDQPAQNLERATIIPPHDGILKKIKIFPTGDPGATTVRIYVNGAGSPAFGQSYSPGNFAAATLATLNIDHSFSSAQRIAISLQPNASMGVTSLTCLWEYDTNT